MNDIQVAQRLGYLAADCDLKAAKPGLDLVMYEALKRQSAKYREAQSTELKHLGAGDSHNFTEALAAFEQEMLK